MWQIKEHRRVDKQLSGSVPIEVLKRYEKWKDIARLSGPQGLRGIKGFHDEALSDEWKGHHSSRLGLQWRVIYRVVADVLLIQVVRKRRRSFVALLFAGGDAKRWAARRPFCDNRRG